MMSAISPVKTPYAVHCETGCGQSFLTEEEYLRQLNKPDSVWQCPRCGDSAGFDDENFDNNFLPSLEEMNF